MQDEKTLMKRRERRAHLKLLDMALSNPPSHLAHRIGKPSKLGERLAGTFEYGWKGTCFNENGEPVQRSDAQKIKDENSKRHFKALEDAKRIRGKYPQHWCSRFGASVIAERENLSTKTVRRYFTMELIATMPVIIKE